MTESPRCPTCDHPLQRPKAATIDSERWPAFPFCSEPCRLIDLHEWLTGGHAIPGPPGDPNHRV